MKQVDAVKKIHIDASVAEGLLARNIQERAPQGVEIEIVENSRKVLDQSLQQGALQEKDSLLVYRHRGRFMSACPGSDGMVCCQYAVINFGYNCLYDCHYCYLQSFLNNPLMSLFGNLEDMFEEIDKKTRNVKARFRIGTGEYTDSLALDPLTGLSRIMVDYFARKSNALLELKTKSSNVDELLNLDHNGNTVVAWSINPPSIVDTIEPGTASLAERLQAARKVQAAGYKLAFHLDPVIYFENWEAEYHSLIDTIFENVDPDRVVWISLGSFRHAPGLKEMIQVRFPDDKLTRAEMIPGPDGKLRYFKEIRKEMYISIRKKIASVDPRLFMYLCMETQRMWETVYDFIPGSAKNLDALFEKRRQFIDSVAPAAASSSATSSSAASE